jgi:RNA polymerase sigma-70 factor (ECF subfamily)
MSPLRPNSRQVFEEQARYAFRVLRYLGVREADLQDVCQEVFITVHRKIDEFEGRSSIRTWLYRICRNAASDYRRRAYVRREIPTDWAAPEMPEGEPSADTRGRAEARSVLQHALTLLDDDKREVFVLYEVEGLTMQEVADIVGCPLQTAYSRLRAARDVVLRAAMEPVGGGIR